MAFASLIAAGRPLRIEYEWVGHAPGPAPLLVFLHEGLGSVAMWRDFPQQLCAAVGARGLVYSRPGYGRSTPRPADEHWSPDFMHVQAREVLPALLDALGVNERPWLFGHSDGGSIALLHAAAFPEAVQGLVVLAPHIFVEEVSIRSIGKARDAYRHTDLRQRLARYHDDPDSAFHGWNDVWLDAAFRGWNIEDALGTIRCPLLAIQGLDDEYGTLEQIRGIARRVPHAQLLELPACGHSPHRDQPEAVIAAVSRCLQAGTPAR
ncbi:alpha/beta hydrolase [Ramlibacter sp. PS3R-8]|uniref:alpha/beta fold hydrolase n=1 Tax=Ramlibacter sp. PS3R-8 TaxID=3133437 RepID=UPI00309560A8